MAALGAAGGPWVQAHGQDVYDHLVGPAGRGVGKVS